MEARDVEAQNAKYQDELDRVALLMLRAIVTRSDEYDMVAQDAAVKLAYAYARAFVAKGKHPELKGGPDDTEMRRSVHYKLGRCVGSLECIIAEAENVVKSTPELERIVCTARETLKAIGYEPRS